jgi:hypothetical protein
VKRRDLEGDEAGIKMREVASSRIDSALTRDFCCPQIGRSLPNYGRDERRCSFSLCVEVA